VASRACPSAWPEDRSRSFYATSRFEYWLQGSPEKAHQALDALLRGNRGTVQQSPGGRETRLRAEPVIRWASGRLFVGADVLETLVDQADAGHDLRYSAREGQRHHPHR
jgi:hypothetical protein